MTMVLQLQSTFLTQVIDIFCSCRVACSICSVMGSLSGHFCPSLACWTLSRSEVSLNLNIVQSTTAFWTSFESAERCVLTGNFCESHVKTVRCYARASSTCKESLQETLIIIVKIASTQDSSESPVLYRNLFNKREASLILSFFLHVYCHLEHI